MTDNKKGNYRKTEDEGSGAAQIVHAGAKADAPKIIYDSKAATIPHKKAQK